MQMPLPLSYSKLSDYEKCPALARYRYIERLGDHLPKSPALARGIEVHNDGERWMLAKGPGPIPGPFQAFESELLPLKKAQALPEPTFYVDDAWGPVKTRDEAFIVGKLDLLHIDPGALTARVIDYKTGRPYDTHRSQGIVYTLLTWAHHPTLREVTVEFWYLDHCEIRDATYRKSNIKGLRNRVGKRFIRLAEDREFKPTPGAGCKWCEFHAKKGGPCAVGL